MSKLAKLPNIPVNKNNVIIVCVLISGTTDVQDVIVACQNESTINITCTYLRGSDARGCVYTLVSMSGEDIKTGNIARGDTEEVAVEQPPYRELIVYDWENDGTIGSVPIRRDVSSAIASCFSTTDLSKQL